ncbi:MAG TPA: RluA family pseudouridine synthase [Vicinamibacterales bacterium]|jgi:23S rRNA pseudouridine1911/1915/1917 synthase|nr:RluA family pseudouridine synthase [Vicinamibacterales bacterium]
MKSDWRVGPHDVGTRLDKFLADSGRLGSRGRATEAIARGKVIVNDVDASSADAGRRLAAGDRVRLWVDRPGTARRRLEVSDDDGLSTVYEDDVLLVLNKPAGLLTVPLGRRSDAPSVYGRIQDRLRSHGRRRPFVVHRIDRDTSGLVIFAKDAATQVALKDQFRRREPERVYSAIVYGCPTPSSGTWSDHLVWDEDASIQKASHPRDPRAKEAISTYKVIEAFPDASLVEIRLVTGKRNQIRLQARLRGHTLVGEQRYTYGPDHLRPIEFPRQALHAHRLAFRHPRSGQLVRFEAPLPADMRELLRQLRRSSKSS